MSRKSRLSKFTLQVVWLIRGEDSDLHQVIKKLNRRMAWHSKHLLRRMQWLWTSDSEKILPSNIRRLRFLKDVFRRGFGNVVYYRFHLSHHTGNYGRVEWMWDCKRLGLKVYGEDSKRIYKQSGMILVKKGIKQLNDVKKLVL